MGFERCVIPAAGGVIPSTDFPSSLKVHAVRSLDEALQVIFD
jgi:hypothetical protein